MGNDETPGSYSSWDVQSKRAASGAEPKSSRRF